MDERCADKLDHAANITTEIAALTIAGISDQVKAMDTTNKIGVCWNCGESTGKERRWCDAVCRDEWQESKDDY